MVLIEKDRERERERETNHLALDPETAMPAGEEEQIVAGAGRKAAAAEAARGGGGQNPSRRRGLVGWEARREGEELASNEEKQERVPDRKSCVHVS